MKTKEFKVSFNLSIADKDMSYSPIVSTSITNDVPRGEDPEQFLRKRLKEEINRMIRAVDEDKLDFEIKEDSL
jgi:hypothetical protein